MCVKFDHAARDVHVSSLAMASLNKFQLDFTVCWSNESKNISMNVRSSSIIAEQLALLQSLIIFVFFYEFTCSNIGEKKSAGLCGRYDWTNKKSAGQDQGS